jgi:alkanesulfonate monooxygenase SsuD/methylene tetrahydromethanopterin reductase-like flavin-dependent oxidoreductase (luciferase family)
MLRLTAELADGWVPESHTPETYKSTLESLHKLMENFERDIEELEPCLASIYYPFEPDERAYRKLLDGAKHYLATYPDILWAASLDHPGLRTHQLVHRQSLWDEIANKVPDYLADRTLIYGTVDKCIDRIGRFIDVGCRHIILEPYWMERDKVKRAIEVAGTKIRQYFDDG